MPIEEIAKSVVQRLQQAGFIAYYAGGYVRDLLMEHPSDDIDIATSASTQQVQELFEKTIPVGISFGIVIVVEKDHQFEVATFRKDRSYVDGRRPTGFDPVPPEEDAARRDFTINGMFYDPITETLFDYVGGADDVQRGIVRAIGDPHLRFSEDRLRMMRAVRYATRFDFPINQETTSAIRAHASELFPSVAMERVWQEFKKMSNFAHFDTGLLMLHDLGLLPTIFPDLHGVSTSDVARRVQHIENFPKGAPTFGELLELFPAYSLDDIELLSEHLKLSKKERDFAGFYFHARNLFNMPEPWQVELEKYEWAVFYADPHADTSLGMVAARFESSDRDRFLNEHLRRKAELADPIERIRTQNPYLRAEDLIAAGVAPGEKLGAMLRQAMRVAVNENITDKTTLLKKLKPE